MNKNKSKAKVKLGEIWHVDQHIVAHLTDKELIIEVIHHHHICGDIQALLLRLPLARKQKGLAKKK